MRYKLVKLEELSGSKTSIYSVYLNESGKTLFEMFLEENKKAFKSELNDIISRLKVIGDKTGAYEHFFKLYEGSPGDGVCALYDKPDKHLRLYCIRYVSCLVILGGGGPKPKNLKSLQEDEKLKKENELLKQISLEITGRIKTKEIEWSEDYMDLLGKLEFNTDYYE